MIYIDNRCLEPWYNLALEEYLLKKAELNEDIVVLWQNRKSVIIGRYQNAAAQVNQKYADEHDICIARRMTGGGAVYHDLGNLNYTFITKYDNSTEIDFREFAIPVIKALDSLGVKAELSGRNDITVEKRKISGTAQAGMGNRIMFHGTLMYDVNTDMLSKVLNVDEKKIQAKGVKSVKSRVTNLKQYLPERVTIEDIRCEIIKTLKNKANVIEYRLTDEDRKAILELMNCKYCTSKWIFGESREGEICSRERFSGGEVEFSFSLNKGYISDCRIRGDFLGIYSIHNVEKMLNGTLYEYRAVRSVLSQINIKNYFGDISADEILKCLF